MQLCVSPYTDLVHCRSRQKSITVSSKNSNNHNIITVIIATFVSVRYSNNKSLLGHIVKYVFIRQQFYKITKLGKTNYRQAGVTYQTTQIYGAISRIFLAIEYIFIY